MEIRLIGSASFLVTSTAGTVVTDPEPDTLSDSSLNDENAIAVFSRQGGIVANFPDSLTIIDGPGEYEVSGVSVFGIPTPAGSDAAVTREVTTQYVIDADGIAVCSLGFIGSIPEARALRATGNIEVLLVPTTTTAQCRRSSWRRRSGSSIPRSSCRPVSTRRRENRARNSGGSWRNSGPSLTIRPSPNSQQI